MGPSNEAMPELVTARLRLEPLDRHHADTLFEGLSQPALYAHLAEAPPASVDALRSRYERLARRRSPDGAEHWLNWALFCPAEGRHVGYVQATVPVGTGSPSIAYVLFANAWGRGFAREAVTAMLDHLRDAYGAREALATVDTRNARSIALLEALGFEQVTVRLGAEWIGGVLTDEGEYRLGLRAGATS